MVQKRERNCNLDIIRCVAVFTVICVHFFLNSEYYTYPIVGERMYIMTFICTAARVCVPLFLLLTGYLMRQKHFVYLIIKESGKPWPFTCWPAWPAWLIAPLSYTTPLR